MAENSGADGFDSVTTHILRKLISDNSTVKWIDIASRTSGEPDLLKRLKADLPELNRRFAQFAEKSDVQTTVRMIVSQSSRADFDLAKKWALSAKGSDLTAEPAETAIVPESVPGRPRLTHGQVVGLGQLATGFVGFYGWLLSVMKPRDEHEVLLVHFIALSFLTAYALVYLAMKDE